jgi:hypothetical protein
MIAFVGFGLLGAVGSIPGAIACFVVAGLFAVYAFFAPN